jgi:hypothetical protein
LIRRSIQEAPVGPVDPWEKAADCARAIERSKDRDRQAELTILQHLWMALGNQQGCLSAEEIDQEIEAIARLHAQLGGEVKSTTH